MIDAYLLGYSLHLQTPVADWPFGTVASQTGIAYEIFIWVEAAGARNRMCYAEC